MVPGVSHFNGDREEMEGEEILTILGVPPSHSALHLLLVPAHECSAVTVPDKSPTCMRNITITLRVHGYFRTRSLLTGGHSSQRTSGDILREQPQHPAWNQPGRP